MKAAWTAQHTFDEVLSALESADVPAGAILNVADPVHHPHFQARELFERVPLPTDPDDTVLLPKSAPFLTGTPGGTSGLARRSARTIATFTAACWACRTPRSTR